MSGLSHSIIGAVLMGCPRSLDIFTQSRLLPSDGEDSKLTGHVRVEVSIYPGGDEGETLFTLTLKSSFLKISMLVIHYNIYTIWLQQYVNRTYSIHAYGNVGLKVLMSRVHILMNFCKACTDESGAQSLGFWVVTRWHVCLCWCSLYFTMLGGYSIVIICL